MTDEPTIPPEAKKAIELGTRYLEGRPPNEWEWRFWRYSFAAEVRHIAEERQRPWSGTIQTGIAEHILDVLNEVIPAVAKHIESDALERLVGLAYFVEDRTERGHGQRKAKLVTLTDRVRESARRFESGETLSYLAKLRAPRAIPRIYPRQDGPGLVLRMASNSDPAPPKILPRLPAGRARDLACMAAAAAGYTISARTLE